MLTLQVVEGHNKTRLATIRKNGIRYRSADYRPLSLRRLDEGASDAGSSLAGAAVGAAAFGAAGAIVGSIIGGSGRTAVLIKTAEGPELVCTVASRDYPALYVEIKRLSSPQAADSTETKHSQSGFTPLLLGPFYFLRVGVGWFILAISITLITFGLAWPIFSILAAVVRYNSKQRRGSTARRLSGVMDFGELAGIEHDFLEPPETAPSAP